MIAIEFPIFALIYVTTGLLGVIGLWFYYDLREKRVYQYERAKNVFHCIKCNHIYMANQRAEVSSCPKCHFENARLKF